MAGPFPKFNSAEVTESSLALHSLGDEEPTAPSREMFVAEFKIENAGLTSEELELYQNLQEILQTQDETTRHNVRSTLMTNLALAANLDSRAPGRGAHLRQRVIAQMVKFISDISGRSSSSESEV